MPSRQQRVPKLGAAGLVTHTRAARPQATTATTARADAHGRAAQPTCATICVLPRCVCAALSALVSWMRALESSPQRCARIALHTSAAVLQEHGKCRTTA